jgi:putative flavoprotein involved in K+ transport
MLKTSAIVVGAGHCGLAMSRCLADRSIDHVVLERGEVAHSWRTQRWDSTVRADRRCRARTTDT